ncbi:MAG: helix-turn-helix domain-containing protein [Acidimicrobiia bacterium]
MTPIATDVDRPAAIRRALRDLVAERGFHGASMSAVAKEAGVAAGTAYVHYDSKEELVHATYLEVKADLAAAVLDVLDPDAPPEARYRTIVRAVYRHLREEPARARFLDQLEVSPYRAEAKRRLAEQGDPLGEQAAAADVAARLVDVPMEVIWVLAFGSLVRLVAAGVELSDTELERVADATWRAITTP